MQKARPRILTILGLGTLLLTVIGLASVGVYALKTKSQMALTPWRDPTTVVREQSIAPDLGLLPLTGMDDGEAISRALFANELDTAYSILVYSTSLSDSERAGKWLLLGQRYQESGERQLAGLCYWVAAEIATFSPFMTDLSRAQTFLQAGTGLAIIQAYGDAELACDQAHDVALYSPYLTSAHRQQILQGLKTTYTAMGRGEEKWMDLARLVTSGQVTASQPPQMPVDTIPPLPVNTEVEQAENARKAAIERMLIVLVPPQREPSKYLLQAVTEALQAEDQVKQRIYSDAAMSAADLPTQVALAQTRVTWLTLKLRIARRATGLSLVPEWEAQESEIREQLRIARETFYELLATYTGDKTPTLIHQQLLVGRLGLYPDYPETALADAIQTGTAQTVGSLRLQVFSQDNARYFVLTGQP